MNCPTCAREMVVQSVEVETVWHCGQCGTLAVAYTLEPTEVRIVAPALAIKEQAS